MSLYNMLHGQNPLTGLFLQMLSLTEGDVGRLRDVHLEKEGDKYFIVVYTRNGGGNRECWNDGSSDDKHYNDENGVCHCTGCIIEKHLPKHPNYVRDYNDDFDCTYASIVFSVPPQHVEYIEHLYAIGHEKDKVKPAEKFRVLLEKMSKGDSSDPAVKNALEVGKAIFGKLNKRMKEGEGVVEV